MMKGWAVLINFAVILVKQNGNLITIFFINLGDLLFQSVNLNFKIENMLIDLFCLLIYERRY